MNHKNLKVVSDAQAQICIDGPYADKMVMGGASCSRGGVVGEEKITTSSSGIMILSSSLSLWCHDILAAASEDSIRLLLEATLTYLVISSCALLDEGTTVLPVNKVDRSLQGSTSFSD